jgi:O-acetyl-ADP-ribose deacetylase (regulator of RNase III)
MSQIRLATASCARSFSLLAHALKESSDASYREMIAAEALADEQGRFRVWAGNLGALQKGHSSLDYRLRDSPLLLENVLKFLEELQNALSEAASVASGQRLPYERQERPAYDSDDDMSVDSLDTSDSDDGDDNGPPSELEMRFADIVDIVNNLYSLSIRIRNPTIKTRALKAAAYRPIDKSTGVDILEQYSHFDKSHAREVIFGLRNTEFNQTPAINEFLIERLGNAITSRRQLFLYWKKHREKLSAAPADEIEVHVADLPPKPSQSSADELKSQKEDAIEIVKIQYSPPSEINPKTLLSATTATQHHKTLDDDFESQSMTSVATTAKDLTGHSIELPPPPSSGDKDFECPYCLTICPSRYGNYRSWRNHLLQDLSPYVCTYEKCHEPNQLYRSRREWEAHEATHRRAWKCPQHPDVIFRSPSGLTRHLTEVHTTEHLTEQQLQSIVAISATSTEDVRSCPVCLVDRSLVPNLQSHIANHLERLATFALPRDVESDGDKEESAKGASNDASRGESGDSVISSKAHSGYSQNSMSEGSEGQSSRTALTKATQVQSDISEGFPERLILEVASLCSNLDKRLIDCGQAETLWESKLLMMSNMLNELDPTETRVLTVTGDFQKLVASIHTLLNGKIDTFFKGLDFYDPAGRILHTYEKINQLCELISQIHPTYPERQPVELSRHLLSQIPDSRDNKLDLLMTEPLDTRPISPERTNAQALNATGDSRVQFSSTLEGLRSQVDFSDVPMETSISSLEEAFSKLPGYIYLKVQAMEPTIQGSAVFRDGQTLNNALSQFDKSAFESIKLGVPRAIEEFPEEASDEDDISSSEDSLEDDDGALIGLIDSNEIPNLIQLYRRGKIQPEPSEFPPEPSFNEKVCLIFYDITGLKVDAIVNATSPRLASNARDSLSYYIHSKAGPDMAREISAYGRSQLGQAIVTDAYNLPCQKVIHAVRPIPLGNYEKLLSSCYAESLRLASENGLKTIAFPALGTGGYGCPRKEAATIALQTTRSFLETNPSHGLEKIIFCMYHLKDEDAYTKLLP